ALRAAAAGADAVDLRRAAAVAHEIDAAAVAGEGGLGVDAAALHQAARFAAVGVDGVELRAAVAAQGDGQRAPVRRPGGRAVGAAEVGDQAPPAGGHLVHVHHRLARLEGDVG